MRLHSYNLALTAALLLLTGCLEMQSQDIHIRCDEANDRIDVALVYRQLKVNTSPHQAMFNRESSNPLDRVLKSLRKVRDGGQFALGPDATFSDPTGSDPQADNIPVELRKHLDVEYGGLITSPSNEFIGYQFLRVNDATEFIIKLNAHIVKHIKTCSGKGEPAYGITFDTETLKSLDAFLAAKGQILSVDDGCIRLQLPLSAASHRGFKSMLFRAVAGDIAYQSTSEVLATVATENDSVKLKAMWDALNQQQATTELFGWLKDFVENDISFSRSPSTTTIRVGLPGESPLTLRLSPESNDSPSVDNPTVSPKLRDHLQAANFDIEDGIPNAEIMRRFETFGTRAAILPKKLIEHRRKIRPLRNG